MSHGLPFVMALKPHRGTWAYGPDAYTPVDAARALAWNGPEDPGDYTPECGHLIWPRLWAWIGVNSGPTGWVRCRWWAWRVCTNVGPICLVIFPSDAVGGKVGRGATSVEVLDGAKLVARHERAVGRYVEVLALDHYLEVLKIKPGALPGATALAQAKASGRVHRLRTSATGTPCAAPAATPPAPGR